MAIVTSIAQLKQESTDTSPAVALGFTSVAGFAMLQRAAKMIAQCDKMIPKEYRNNEAKCAIALEMANRVGTNFLAVMQSLYDVHGRPSWSSQFIISAINTCGRFSPLRFDITDMGEKSVPYTITYYDSNNQKQRKNGNETIKDRQCIAWAIEKATGERLESAPVTIEMAVLEGWYTKDGSKWKTMPDLMLRYRAAAFFGRIYAPEVLMGMRTAEEVHDTFDMESGEDGSYSVKIEDMKPGTLPSEALNAELDQAADAMKVEDSGEQAAPRTRPTAAEMESKRQAVKAELDRLGVFQAVQDSMSKSWTGWNTAECEKAEAKGRELAAKREAPAESGQAVKLVECPDEPDPINAELCDSCAKRDGCPAWKVGE